MLLGDAARPSVLSVARLCSLSLQRLPDEAGKHGGLWPQLLVSYVGLPWLFSLRHFLTELILDSSVGVWTLIFGWNLQLTFKVLIQIHG